VIKHWILTVFRYTSKNKLSFGLNLFGLVIGLACSFTILNYILYEYGFDRMHKNKNCIYRVNTEMIDLEWKFQSVPYVLYNYLESVPEIKSAAIIGSVRNAQIQIKNEFFDLNSFRSANSEIFDVLTFDFISGSKETALINPNSLVVGRSFVENYFAGNYNIIGKAVNIKISNELYVFNITGIIEDLLDQSTEKIRLLTNNNFSKSKKQEGTISSEVETSWQMKNYIMYLLLDKGSNIDTVNHKLAKITETHCENPDFKFSLQALLKIHLFASNFNNSNNKGILKIYLFLLVGLSLFLITCTNFTLFSIGQYSLRTREIGIKKVFGASSYNLINEYLFDSFIISIISLPLAIIVSGILNDHVSQVFGTEFYFIIWTNPTLLLTFLFLTIILIFLGGVIYSFRVSRLNPELLLHKKTLSKGSKVTLPKILITIQVAIFCSLLTSSQIVYKQIEKSIEMDKGFNDKNLFEFSINRSSKPPNYKAFKEEILQSPYIFGISGGANIPPSKNSSKTPVEIPGEDKKIIYIENIFADYDLAKVLELRFIKGRWFLEENIIDSDFFVINKQSLKDLELKDSSMDCLLSQKIIGVVEDFNFRGAKEKIQAQRIVLNPELSNRFFILRFEEDHFNEAKNHLTSVLAKYDLEIDDEIILYRENVENQSYSEMQMFKIIILFGIISILMAILGLFGHSVFVAQSKIFPSGMRIIFGATTVDILKYYLHGFVFPVVFGNVISTVIVFYLMTIWLQDYAYPISIPIWYFVQSILISGSIVIISVLYNFRYLSHLKPIDLIRNE